MPTFQTAIGPLSYEVTETGAVRRLGFGIFPLPGPNSSELERQVAEFFAGSRSRFELALDPQGTPFQLAVWAELTRIPKGQTRTYAQIAKAIGRPSATRAVGAANGANPIALIVPCHRVVGTDGSLTGFAGGLQMKSRLLDFERGSLFSEF